VSAPEGGGKPSTGRSRLLDSIEIGLWLALVFLGGRVALEVVRLGPLEQESRPPMPSPVAIPGLVEAEDLPRDKSRSFGFWMAPTLELPGVWSQGAHMFGTEAAEGDWVDLELPGGESGRYELEVFLTKAPDYGIVALSLGGERVAEVDLWTARGVHPTGPIALGEVELGERQPILRIELVGANPRSAAPRFQFGVDGVRLTPVAP
jgi:hypothetical protein